MKSEKINKDNLAVDLETLLHALSDSQKQQFPSDLQDEFLSFIDSPDPKTLGGSRIEGRSA